MRPHGAASEAARPSNRLGATALVLALVVSLAPLATWIVVAVAGTIEQPNPDDAVYVGLIGGFIVFTGVIGILSPLALVATILGIVSLFRPGRRAPGVVAIVLGGVGTLGLLWLPYVLSEVVPGW